MEAVRITHSELLEAIADASRGTAPQDARTVADLMADTGRPDKAIRRALGVLHAQGRLIHHRVQRENIAGVTVTVPAYTVRPAKRKA